MSTPNLNTRVAALEAAVKAIQAGAVADQLQPNVLQVNADGTITALLTGALLLEENQSGAGLNEPNAVAWQDPTNVIREFLMGYLAGADHVLVIAADALAAPSGALGAQIGLVSAPSGAGAGSTYVILTAIDGAHVQQLKALDSNGSSAFLMGGLFNPPVITRPTRTIDTPYTPDALHPTLVVANVFLSGGSPQAQLYVDGAPVDNIYIGAAGANGFTLPMVALVPADGTYEIVQIAPTVAVDTAVGVIEYQL